MHAVQFEEMITPEALLPEQFEEIWRGKRAITSERALLIAVLWQAAEDLRENPQDRRSRIRRLYWNAYRWVASDNRSWPYSFLNVCDLLGVSAGLLRAELLGAGGRRLPARSSNVAAIGERRRKSWGSA